MAVEKPTLRYSRRRPRQRCRHWCQSTSPGWHRVTRPPAHPWSCDSPAPACQCQGPLHWTHVKETITHIYPTSSKLRIASTNLDRVHTRTVQQAALMSITSSSLIGIYCASCLANTRPPSWQCHSQLHHRNASKSMAQMLAFQAKEWS